MATLGYNTAGALTDFDPGNYLQVCGPYTAGASGPVTSGFAYLSSGAEALSTRVVVYNDNAGTPVGGTSFDYSNEIVLAANQAAAWVTFGAGWTASVVSGNAYWVGLWFGPGWLSAHGLFYYDATAIHSKYKGSQTYASTGGPTTPFPIAPSDTTEQMSVYINFGTAGKSTPTNSNRRRQLISRCVAKGNEFQNGLWRPKKGIFIPDTPAIMAICG